MEGFMHSSFPSIIQPIQKGQQDLKRIPCFSSSCTSVSTSQVHLMILGFIASRLSGLFYVMCMVAVKEIFDQAKEMDQPNPEFV